MRAGVLAVALATGLAVAGTASPAGATKAGSDDRPLSVHIAGASPTDHTGTIPWWSGSFTDPTNGSTYTFKMVGTDPRSGTSTTVPTVIVPIKLRFRAGNQDTSALAGPGFPAPAPLDATLDATGPVTADTVQSPIFRPTHFDASNDTTQYGDAVMRAQFGKVGTGYHVLLGQPRMLPTVTIDVPTGQGFAFRNRRGILVGRVDYNWWVFRTVNLVQSLSLSRHELPIMLTDDLGLYMDNNYAQCCVVGFHVNGPTDHLNGTNPIATYIWSSWLTPGFFGNWPDLGAADINVLSHEVAEWLDDPFNDNLVQPWTTGSGCNNVLEVADPLFGVSFTVPGNPASTGNPTYDYGGMWHPQDVTFLDWFARNGQSPDLTPTATFDGHPYYSYLGPVSAAKPGLQFLNGTAPSC
jgi:hypothetical protein